MGQAQQQIEELGQFKQFLISWVEPFERPDISDEETEQFAKNLKQWLKKLTRLGIKQEGLELFYRFKERGACFVISDEVFQKIQNSNLDKEIEWLKQLVDSMPENPYEVLNIPQNATKEEIKKAYRKLAHQYHPDKTAQLGPEIQEVAHRKMQEINEAYELLLKESEYQT